MMILRAALSEEKREELVQKFAKMASDNTTIEKWGIKKFAQPIEYKNEGYYVLMHFVADATKIAEMNSIINITDGVIRAMFTQKTDKMLAWDAKRKADRKAFKEKQAAREAAVAAETPVVTE